MNFLFGVVVGAVLMLGSAYVHDTGMAKFGPPQAFVNWDVVLSMWPK